MILRSKHLAPGVVALLLATNSMSVEAQGRGGATAPPRAGAAMSPGTSASAPAVAPEYRIGTEDVLDVRVMEHDDLNLPGIQVRPDGRISLPLVNDIQAAGLTPMELRAAIIKALEPHWKNQEVFVLVRAVNSSKFSVIGAVKASNRFELRSQMTVLEGIAVAGGIVPDFAEADKIYVLHADGKRTAFNYKKFMADPALQANFLLKSGDLIVVPER